MARVAFWKGYLKLSLVTCPVTLAPATTESEKIRFHLLNRATGNRVESRYVDSVTGRAVAEDNEVKAYARGEDDFVLLEDEEIASVALDSTRTIDIETFVESGAIDWVWYDRPHFLTPSDKVGAEAFCVIRDAMRAKGVVGIARLVLYRRERAVLLEPSGRGIVLWTLRYGDEVRPADELLALETLPDAESLALVERLIAARTETWSPRMTRDPVQERLSKLIAAKKKGRGRPAAAAAKKAAPAAGNVVDIMDALKRSLAEAGKGKSR